MKMALYDIEGKELSNEGLDIGKVLAGQVVESLMISKYMAEELGEEINYIKIVMDKKTIIAGIEDNKVVIMAPASEQEELEAVERFSRR